MGEGFIQEIYKSEIELIDMGSNVIQTFEVNKNTHCDYAFIISINYCFRRGP